MNSQQRRIERYKIIYVWKTLGKLVPGANLMLANEGEQSFQVAGPILFNCLPKEIRNKKGCGVEEFKENLDKFLLQTIPDEPKIGGAMPVNIKQSNSIIHQLERGG